MNRQGNVNILSSSLGADLGPRSDSRSLSPLDRQAGTSPSRRRQSLRQYPTMLSLCDWQTPSTRTPRTAAPPNVFRSTLLLSNARYVPSDLRVLTTCAHT